MNKLEHKKKLYAKIENIETALNDLKDEAASLNVEDEWSEFEKTRNAFNKLGIYYNHITYKEIYDYMDAYMSGGK